MPLHAAILPDSLVCLLPTLGGGSCSLRVSCLHDELLEVWFSSWHMDEAHAGLCLPLHVYFAQ